MAKLAPTCMQGAENKVQKPVDRRKYVARELLIELLACQFAFPVRWIETQDEIFSQQDAVQRLIEIGPAKVLAGMAKQTADIKYASHDLAKSIQRSYLSTKTNLKDIYFEYEPDEETVGSTAKEEVPKPTENAEATVRTEPVTVASESQNEISKVPDAPVSAHEILLSLVASKINKKFDQISTTKSIKELTGGKSTLQNELVGLVEAEFSNMPPAAEDLPLQKLYESLQQGFTGKLGKEVSRLVSRFLSAKMPAGFGQSEIREYLEQFWGLQNGRQTSVILLAAASQPESRLSDKSAARAFFDSVITQYSGFSGVTIAKVAPGKQQTSANTVVDSKQIEALRKEQNDRLHKHLNVLTTHLNVENSNDTTIREMEQRETGLKTKLDLWSSEFEDEFERGIQPAFDTRKLRKFNSWWNNVRQDIIRLFHECQNTPGYINNSCLERRILHIANRSDSFVRKLVGRLNHVESQKPNSTPGMESDWSILVYPKLSKALAVAKTTSPVFRFTHCVMEPQTNISPAGIVLYKEVPRQLSGQRSYADLLRQGFVDKSTGQNRPYVSIQCQSKNSTNWWLDEIKTKAFLDVFDQGIDSGISFEGKDVLITGAGPKSIGAEVLRGLLMGGARVIVTSSRSPAETRPFYQELYSEYGARGSELLVLPFNQGSKQDCTSLIDYIYSEAGLNRNLDAIIPFAAISERGEIDGLGGKSELAHRIMLVNVLRILGDIVRNKTGRGLDTSPTQVLLPLSPNHGMFGGDGLYAESKLGLESLLHRYNSESWSDYLHICGAVIGWTRGTDLMSDNDTVAKAIESHNALTFSQREMAFNLLALMADPIVSLCELEPVLADLNGGLDSIPDLKNLLLKTREDLKMVSEIRKAIAAEDVLEEQSLREAGHEESPVKQHTKRSTLKIGHPHLPNYEREIEPLRHLEGMVDLSTVPVVVGFSELGPWGSSRTRWEMESTGTFTQEGYVEMAWMMNLIKFFDGEKDGKHYAGWVDAKTEAIVHDNDVGTRYGNQILDHSGIRLVEPSLLGGYDPNKKEYQHEVAIEENLPEFDASRATAEAFKLRHGDKVSIRQIGDTDNFKILLKRGASIMIPKAVPFEGLVAGQIPTGWDPTKYGIPEDIVKQVDPVTTYTLCCVAEALYSAGLSDASELLQHIHISEIGNFIGSMMGGTTKTRNMYKDRYLDKDVQGDVMQETYLNTTAAWINMLLLGTAGPIKTPSGACATSIESIDNACESILSGKTKLCFVGGTDDFQEEESYAFRTMNATVNAQDEFAKGRLPSEMSRPTSDTRSGFVEGQGSGVQLVTTAEVALDLGLPVYGVIAASSMAGDKISRSVPAPGQGMLSFARESADAKTSPLLDMNFRRREMETAIERAQLWRTSSLRKNYTISNSFPEPSADPDKDLGLNMSMATSVATINSSTSSQIQAIQRLWGNDFRKQDSRISPLRAGLATWGLCVDDIDFASLHATSTKANDKNEPEIINKQMEYLGRTLGNPILSICQKSVTGHPKAPAAGFMLNGCLQVLNTGLVPGNRNADNVDTALSRFEHLTFPTLPIQTRGLKAFSLTSFGFGQKGGQLIGIHPRYLYAAIDRPSYDAYVARLTTRTRSANRAYLSALLHNRIVVCKPTPHYPQSHQDSVLLDPASRISARTVNGEAWRYDPHNLHGEQSESDAVSETQGDVSEDDNTATLYTPTKPSVNDSGMEWVAESNKYWLEASAARLQESESVNVGIDVEDILSAENADLQSNFVLRNYTTEERNIAAQSSDPRSTLTGRWSAKEAVFKSLGTKSKGAGAAMNEIEILTGENGSPHVKLHGDAFAAAQDQGITDIRLSLSHSTETAIAVALAIRGHGQPSY